MKGWVMELFIENGAKSKNYVRQDIGEAKILLGILSDILALHSISKEKCHCFNLPRSQELHLKKLSILIIITNKRAKKLGICLLKTEFSGTK